MKLINILSKKLGLFLIIILILSSCEKEEDPPIPTKTSMEGVWVVSEAYGAAGDTIMNKISFPIAAFYLSSDNTVLSTGGPMTTYLVYGDSKWTEISSKIDAIFNYASLTFNGGEFFIGGEQQERFTLEMKLEGIAGTSTLVEILEIVGITNVEWLKEVVYHKFIDVKVSFRDTERNIMVWEFDDLTFAEYNMKDDHGYYVLWQGWPVNNFSKCKFVLTKKTKTLKTVVEEAL